MDEYKSGVREVVQYIIEKKTECGGSKAIGSVYYRNIDKKNKSAEYGIFIGEDNSRGKGYGSETAHLFIKFGFEKLKLHRIYLRLLSENYIAMKLYKNVGFVVEGIAKDMIKIDENYIDIIFMAIINRYI